MRGRIVSIGMFAGLVFAASAFAQEAVPTGPEPEARDKQIRHRYEQSLTNNPFQDGAFDRVYESYLNFEGIDAWIARLESEAASGSSAGSYVALGRIYERQFKTEAALEALDKARAAGIDDPQFGVLYGTLCYQAGRNDEAIEHLTAALDTLEDEEQRGNVVRLLGSLFMREGDPDAAVAAWERSTEINPDDLFIQTELAEIYEDNRMWERAIGTYRRIIELDPSDPYLQCRSLRAIGRCHLELEQHQDAIAVFEQALGLVAPGNWLFEDLKVRLVAVYQDLGDLDGLAQYLVARIADASGDIELRDLLAETYSRMGRFEDAESEYKAMLERSPGRVGAYEDLLSLYARMEREADVIATYEKLIELYPTEPDYLRRLGEVHLTAGRPEDAKSIWRRWVETERTPRRLADLAAWFESYEFPTEAIAAYEEAIAESPDREWSLRLAALKHDQGDVEAALAVWKATLDHAEVKTEEYAEIAAILQSHGYDDEAEPLLLIALEIAPDHHETRLALAQNFMRADRVEEALPHFEQLSAADDNEYFAERGERGLLDCYLKLGVMAEKQSEWEREAEANPDSAPHLARLARLHDRTGARDIARGLYARCAELEPDNPEYLRALAKSYSASREIEQAIEMYERLIAMDATRAGGYHREVLGIYLNADLKDEAIATAQKVVEIAPGDAEARLDLAQVYQTYAMTEEALTQYRFALRLEPDEPQYHRMYGQALAADQRWGEAQEAYRNMLATAKEDATRLAAVQDLAGVYLQQDQLEELIREFQRRVRNTPKKLSTYEELAAVYSQSGDAIRGIEQLEEGLNAVDDKVPALKSLIRATYEAQQFEKVATYYEDLIARAGQAGAYEYERLGTVYHQLGEMEKARETWAKITENDSENPRAFTTLARVLRREGYGEEAIVAQERALELDPTDHRLRFEYAQQLAGSEQPERAIAEYQQILDLGEGPKAEAEESQEKQVNRRSRGAGAGNQAYMWSGRSRFYRGSASGNWPDFRKQVVTAMVGTASNSVGADALIDDLRKRIEENPSNVDTKLDLLTALQAAGRGPEIVELAEALVAERPDDIAVLEETAAVYSSQQQVEKAIGVLERLAELQPKQRSQHQIALLSLHLRLGDSDVVDTMTASILEEFSGDATMLSQVMSAFSANGEIERCIALLPALDSIDARQRGPVQAQVASALRQSGDVEKATELYRSLLFDTGTGRSYRYTSQRQRIYAPDQNQADSLQYLMSRNWTNGLSNLGLIGNIDFNIGNAIWSLMEIASTGEARDALYTEIETHVHSGIESTDAEKRTYALQLGKMLVGYRLSQSEPEAALEALDKLQAAGGDDIECFNLRAFTLEQMDREDEMLAVYDAIRDRFPSRARDLLEARTQAAFAREDYETASANIESYFAQGVPPAKAISAIRRLYSAGEKERARALLDTHLKGLRRGTEALQLLAQIHADENEFEEALTLSKEVWNRTAHRGASQQMMYTSSGIMYLSSGGYYTSYYGGGMSIANNPVLQQMYGYAKLAGQGSALIAEFEDRLAKQPGSTNNFENLISLYTVSGDRAKAIEACERLIESKPNYTRAKTQLAEMYVQRGDQDKALAIYEELMERNPTAFSSVQWQVRNLYQRAGQGDQLAAIDSQIVDRATNPNQLEQLGQQFQEQGELERSAELYKQALAMDPSRVHINSQIANVYRELGRLDEALEAYMAYLSSPMMRGNRYVDNYTANNIVGLFHAAGRLDELERHVSEQMTDKTQAQTTEFLKAVLAKYQGRMDEADAQLRQLLENQGPNQSHLVSELLDLAEVRGTGKETLAFLGSKNAMQNYHDPQRAARLYLSTGTVDEALAQFDRMATMYGGSYGYREAFDQLVSYGLWEQAGAFFERNRRIFMTDNSLRRRAGGTLVGMYMQNRGFAELIDAELAKPMKGTSLELLRSVLNYDSGAFVSNKARLEEYIVREPENADLQFELAKLLESGGYLNESIPYFEQYLADDPADDGRAGAYTSALIQLGRDDEAIALLRARWEERPDHGRTVALAQGLRQAGRYAESAALKQRALEAADSADRRQLAIDFGQFEAQHGDIEAGVAAYRTAFEESPDANTFSQYMGHFVQQGMWQEAHGLFLEHLDSAFVERWRMRDEDLLIPSLRMGDTASVAERWWKLARFNNRWERTNAATEAVRLFRNFGQTEALLSVLERAAAADLDNEVLTWTVLASVYQAAGRHESAREYYVRLLERNPYDTAARGAAAVSLKELGRTDDLIALLSRPSGHSDLNSIAAERVGLARAQFEAGLEDAGTASLEDLTAWAKSPEISYAIGSMFMDLNRFDDALPYMEQGVTPYTEGQHQGVQLAALYARLGRVDDAVALWTRHRTNEQFRNIGDVFMAQESYTAAEQVFQQQIKDKPGEVSTYVSLARAQLAQGNRDGYRPLMRDAATQLSLNGKRSLRMQYVRFLLNEKLEIEAAGALSSEADEVLAGALAEALLELTERKAMDRALALQQKLGGVAPADPRAMIKLGRALIALEVDNAEPWFMKAAEFPDATFEERRDAAFGLCEAGAYNEAMVVLAPLLEARPGLAVLHDEIIEIAAKCDDEETSQRVRDSVPELSLFEEHTLYWNAVFDYHRSGNAASVETLLALAETPRLTVRQIETLCELVEDAGREADALPFYNRFISGGLGRSQELKARQNVVEIALAQGDMRQAIATYAGVLPVRSDETETAAGLIADSVTPENLMEAHDTIAALIAENPAHARVSDLAAFYCELAERAGSPVDSGAILSVEGISDSERAEAANWESLIEVWQVRHGGKAVDNTSETLPPFEQIEAAIAKAGSGVTTDAATEMGVVDLGEAVELQNGDSRQFVFAETVIDESASRRAEFHVGASGEVAVWVNGKPSLYSREYTNMAYPDQYRFWANLDEGPNRIVVQLRGSAENLRLGLGLVENNQAVEAD